jgi:hypothetical protein
MNKNAIDASLFVLAVCLAVGAVHRARPIVPVEVRVPVPPAAARSPAPMRPIATSTAVAAIVEGNPFRLSRRPALIRVGQPIVAGLPTAVAPPPKVRPAMSVRAITGGPPWSALVEGLPQMNGATIVREGWQQGELTITSISRDTVVVAGRDTVWKLTMKRENP